MEDAPEPAARLSHPDDVIAAKQRLGEVKKDVADDPDLSALYQVWADGYETCEEQAKALGWDLRRVVVARRKMQRRARRGGPPPWEQP